MRNVSLAHVLVKIRFTDGVFYLLHKNNKWGDWSLVGGHVEPGEEGEWARTAYRETQEEMQLQHQRDFVLVPLLEAPILFGPRPSRSAEGQLTLYKAQFFRLVFKHDPRDFLSHLVSDEFELVPEADVPQRDDVGELVKELNERLPGGIRSVPPAWEVAAPREAALQKN